MVNKRIAKFRPGIAFTICTKQFLFPKKNNRERPETGIKDGFEEMEHEFPLGLFCSEKTGVPFQKFLCSRKFSRWKDLADCQETFCEW